MNLYVRYFNDETLVRTPEEVLDFLSQLNIPDLAVNDALYQDVKDYAEGSVVYPKRYKVHAHAYFIIIKTVANTMAEFKANNGQRNELLEASLRKDTKITALKAETYGWYEGTLLFRRVAPIPGTGKFQYIDTRFVAQVKGESGQECYDRMVNYLRNRRDVDSRSQFPSSRGKNFSFVFLGPNLTSNEQPEAIEETMVESAEEPEALEAMD